MDMDNAEENLERFKKAYPDIKIFPCITLLAEGLDMALLEVANLIEKTPVFALMDEETKQEGVTYKFVEEDKEIHVANLGNGQWRLSGPRIERLIMKSRTDTEEDIMRLGFTMRKMGVDQLLRDKGALDGDMVYIMDYSFEFSENYDY